MHQGSCAYRAEAQEPAGLMRPWSAHHYFQKQERKTEEKAHNSVGKRLQTGFFTALVLVEMFRRAEGQLSTGYEVVQ